MEEGDARAAPDTDMGRKIRRFLMAALLLIFLGSTAVILYVKEGYRASEALYSQASEQYTASRTAEPKEEEERAESLPVSAPIEVDFDALRMENADIVGWIYCEDTPVNYPVLQGSDNDYYLKNSYDGSRSASGAIFIDANNQAGFADCNTIVYGHNMKNGSMFASLFDWADQEFYEKHPIIWLLTPEQDYQIVLMSGCMTSAHSQFYTICQEPCEEFEQYLKDIQAASDFQPVFQPEGTGNYVLLSTCAYVFDNARYVLFGKLVPAKTAGGRQIMENEEQIPE